MGDLLAAVRAATIDFEAPDADQARTTRDEVADQMSDYILPRLVQLDAPLLAVVGGSTGAGKSTLVNSIVGSAVTPAGILRPTTRSPMLIHHPDDAEWFSRDRLLPDLERVGPDGAASTYGLQLVETTEVPSGLALLDAPDVDSIDEVNRDLAAQLLAAADLWLFITSAARYADQVPWEYLRRAADRATSLAVVLDRTDDEAVDEVRTHLARMMTARGLSDSPLFTVPEIQLTDEGLIPAERVAPIAGWLRDLAADPRARRLIVGRTLDGAVRHVVLRSHDVADSMEAQIEVADILHGGATDGYADAVEQVGGHAADGSLMTGEVLARWQALVGTGDLLTVLDGGSIGRSDDLAGVIEAVEDSVRLMIVDAADRAAEQVAERWATTPSGQRLVDGGTVDRASTDLRVRAERVVRDWRGGVTASLRALAKHDIERVDQAAEPLTLAVLVEVLVSQAEGRGSVPDDSRRLLEAAFDAGGASELVEVAHQDLVSRVEALFDTDRDRYVRKVQDPAGLEAEQLAIRDAARSVEAARHDELVTPSGEDEDE